MAVMGEATPVSLLCSSEVNRMALPLLGSATWSILDQGMNGTSNMRIAIACGDRNHRTMQPPQVAVGAIQPSLPEKSALNL